MGTSRIPCIGLTSEDLFSMVCSLLMIDWFMIDWLVYLNNVNYKIIIVIVWERNKMCNECK